jgi:SAM-dependent methyltransferase
VDFGVDIHIKSDVDSWRNVRSLLLYNLRSHRSFKPHQITAKMSQPKPGSYKHGHSSYTTATHERRTAESDAAFLLPHIKATDTILDVGCGPGTITTGLARHASAGSTIGVDISAAVLDKARTLAAQTGLPKSGAGSVSFQEGNVLQTLPFPDDTFDVVFASQVFGHLVPSPEMPLRALTEIRRVLKPGGLLATRDGLGQHFYPAHFDLDTLWGERQSRGIAGPGGDPSRGSYRGLLPALMRQAGFGRDGVGKVQIGAGVRAVQGDESRKFLAWRAKGQLSEGDPFRQAWLNVGITEEEIQQTINAVEAWAATDDAWMLMLQCEMLAWK